MIVPMYITSGEEFLFLHIINKLSIANLFNLAIQVDILGMSLFTFLLLMRWTLLKRAVLGCHIFELPVQASCPFL